MNNNNENQNMNMGGSLGNNEVLGSVGSVPNPSLNGSSLNTNQEESLNGSVAPSSSSVNPVSEPVISPVAPPVIPSMDIVEPVIPSEVASEPVGVTPNVSINSNDYVVPTSTTTPEVIPTNPVDTTVISPSPVNPTPQETFNLQPEGVVPTVSPASEEPVNGPLMGMSLTDTSTTNTLNATEPAPMNVVDTNAGNMNMGMGPIGPSMAPPTNNDLMGGVPLPPEMPSGDNKKKPKISMPLLIVLIVFLVFLVGFGLYYVLVLSKSKTSAIVITPVLSEVELGSNILNAAASYATVSGMSIANCTVESNLDVNKTGTYEYSVTCGGVVSKGNKVIVTDNVAPEMILKDVVLYPNTAIMPEDFVASISDASEYTLEFLEEPDTMEEGEFEVVIVAKDAYGNEANATGKLIITEDAPQYYLSCESTHESSNYSNAQMEKIYKYGINLKGELYNTREIISYVFANVDDYQVAVDAIMENQFDGVEGLITKDDETYTISITKNLELEDLSQEFTVNPFPTMELEIEAVHTERNEICSLTID